MGPGRTDPVSWEFVVEGQPISWNAGYEIGVKNRKAYNRGDHSFRTIVKKDAAVAYTTLVTIRAREQKPPGWAPEGFVVVELYYYLGRDIDCDNVMKFVNDGIELATGVDDKWYLPRAMLKVTGLRPSERRLMVHVIG